MRCFAGFALVAMLQGCGDFPRDSRDTLKRVEAGAPLRVGYSISEPWVRGGGSASGPAGVEPDLIRAWAREKGARIVWTQGSEGQLVEALAQNSVDVAVGGFLSTTPHGAMIGTTQPYLSAKIVIGAAPGAAAPEDWEKVPVRYDARRPEFAAAIAKAKAVPVAAGAGQLRPFAAVYEAELAALGLRPAGKTLRTEKRVIATAPAENALTLSLDRFLHPRKGAIEARLAAEARR